jgi:hypothetical protein
MCLSSLVVFVTEPDQGSPVQEAHVGKLILVPYSLSSRIPNVRPSFARPLRKSHSIRM